MKSRMGERDDPTSLVGPSPPPPRPLFSLVLVVTQRKEEEAEEKEEEEGEGRGSLSPLLLTCYEYKCTCTLLVVHIRRLLRKKEGCFFLCGVENDGTRNSCTVLLRRTCVQRGMQRRNEKKVLTDGSHALPC